MTRLKQNIASFITHLPILLLLLATSYTSRFTLIPERGNPHGALAFSTFNFLHERTGKWKHAVTAQYSTKYYPWTTSRSVG
ncbi:hypothetical protein NDA11_001786 [Ustilago hordei]|uniref:Uncharacterized protein n=1 Tax=Ustilago hordei TaxID=120017 RepID=I2FSA1_USTHO|nr:uncharacterized protein UHO2_05809 [Ustilago hordei]KAJ1042004.1 hypothetical protein NDA10_000936 [Ustilago hordei]KAJ1573401.1 hypothetical protein NDA15_007537 [Ustilago hordei]KAJ1574816.1 hypothetical protein NDA12_005631 [Ustilago hordei]KAJ1576599.1 hypothetical protein NDA11_001786 [Ustilago hordei]KAJ1596206.1 hypothetical protein NDA14_000728 [Ustilago hordei]